MQMASTGEKKDTRTTTALVAVGTGVIALGSFLVGRYLVPSKNKRKVKHYKLTYFHLQARGEVSRLLFHAADVDFEDVRFPMSESFEHAEMVRDKHQNPEKYPWGQLPTLTIDGEILAQSHAIERYLARQFDLMGADDLEAAQIDGVMEAMDDVTNNFVKVRFGTPEEQKRSAFVEHYEKFDRTFTRLEDMLNDSGNGFLMPSGFSLADLSVYQWIHTCAVDDLLQKVYNNHPRLEEHRKNVEQIPAIAKYLKTRENYFI